MTETMKQCPKCQRVLPRNDDNWFANRRTADGLHNICRRCHNETMQTPEAKANRLKGMHLAVARRRQNPPPQSSNGMGTSVNARAAALDAMRQFREDHEVFSPKEIAEATGLPVHQVYEALAGGALIGVRGGREWKVTPVAIQAWLHKL